MKKRVGVFAGGPSVEHEISLQSAKNIFDHIDSSLYEKVLIGITKSHEWYFIDANRFYEIHGRGELFCLDQYPELFLRRCLFDEIAKDIDIAFPALHGYLGEDGAFQGMMRCFNIPCVGPSLTDAALCMDKDLLKRVAASVGINVTPFITLTDIKHLDTNEIEKSLGFPVFVKPATSGSSLGVVKIKKSEELYQGVKEAFRFAQKIIIEKGIDCREIECSALGNDEIFIATPGEVVCHHEFYSYEAKYLDANGASLKIPAPLPLDQLENVKELAKQAYQIAGCRGMARIDFFMDKEGVFYLNEINTIPGFTRISLYPKLIEYDGIMQKELVNRLIKLGCDQFKKEKEIVDSGLLLSLK